MKDVLEFIFKFLFFCVCISLVIITGVYGFKNISITPAEQEIMKSHIIKKHHILTNISCVKTNYFKEKITEDVDTEVIGTEVVVLSKLNDISHQKDYILETLNDTVSEDILNLIISIPSTSEIQYISSLKEKYKLWPEVSKSLIRLYFMDNIIIKVNDISMLSKKIKLFKNVSNDELERYIFEKCKKGFVNWTTVDITEEIKVKFSENKFFKEFNDNSNELNQFNDIKENLGI